MNDQDQKDQQEPKRFISIEEFKKKAAPKVREAYIEGLGYLRVRGMTPDQAMRHFDSAKNDKRHNALRLAQACTVNEDGTPFFSDEDLAWFSASGELQPFMRLQTVLNELNGTDGKGARLEPAKNA